MPTTDKYSGVRSIFIPGTRIVINQVRGDFRKGKRDMCRLRVIYRREYRGTTVEDIRFMPDDILSDGKIINNNVLLELQLLLQVDVWFSRRIFIIRTTAPLEDGYHSCGDDPTTFN